MKPGYTVVLLLLLTAILIWGITYLSTHDRIEEVEDVSMLRLDRGRRVFLLGVQSTAKWDSVEAKELTQVEKVWSIVEVDTPRVQRLEEQVDRQGVTLEFVEFEPDSSSQDLHAYVWLDDTLLNAWIIEQGLARVNREQSHPQAEQFLRHEQEAKAAGRGIWAMPAQSASADSAAAPN
ncbi:MAG: hypothetical protein MAG453_01963 [Calditrichaeota bacterium]|nr:hypothetical protein [Calditrichota bacterium]